MEPSYPGYNVPLRDNIEHGDSFPIGAHWANNDSVTEMLQVLEVFMMALMDQLTDKADWERKVFDDEIVAKWRKEAVTQPEDDLYALILEDKDLGRLRKPRERMINEEVFECCIEELRCKAEYFKQTSLVPTLDTAGRVVVKSDVVVQPTLHQRLVESFSQLRSDQASNVDWHPRSNDMVQDLVHPSMYPFVYGRSNFFPAEIVGLKGAVQEWAGKGDVIVSKGAEMPSTTQNIPEEFWSDNYQWLPANLKFDDDGLVKFTSYVNNLHPEKYPEIYKALEELIDVAIPAWNQCLPLHIDGNEPYKAGRVDVRLDKPNDCPDNSDEKHWTPNIKSEHVKTFQLEDKDKSDYDYAYESHGDYLDDLDIDSDTEEKLPNLDDETSQVRSERRESKRRLRAHREVAWERVKDPAELPLPQNFEHIDYAPQLDLRKKFNGTGLQVIVKMASIELTPEKPQFPLGSWHIEGQLNERICATALYYLDSENVTESHLTFRMASDAEQSEFSYGQDEYEWIERVYGTLVGSMSSDPSLQVFGSVETRPGRLLAFPNVFQHRVSSFSLKDKTSPGHRRFIALWLIDPHRRVISTANVPPQQFDWWAEAVFGAKESPSQGSMPPGLFHLILKKYPQLAEKYGDALAGEQLPSALPRELWDMVSNDQTPLPGLMSLAEAKEHRLRLMDERSRFHKDSDQLWKRWTYRFCEH